MAVEHLDYSKLNLTPLQGGADNYNPEEVTLADVEKILRTLGNRCGITMRE